MDGLSNRPIPDPPRPPNPQTGGRNVPFRNCSQTVSDRPCVNGSLYEPMGGLSIWSILSPRRYPLTLNHFFLLMQKSRNIYGTRWLRNCSNKLCVSNFYIIVQRHPVMRKGSKTQLCTYSLFRNATCGLLAN